MVKPVGITPFSCGRVTSPVFQAQTRPTAPITWKGRIITVGKILFFPITLLYLLIQAIAAKLAYSLGVGASKSTDESRRDTLRQLNGTDVIFKTEDGVKLEGMYFSNPYANEKSKTVLICSGSHRSYEFYVIPQVDALLKMGHHVLIFNYRGFGKSEGIPSEKGFYLDAEAAYQYIQSLGASPVVALGYSMGGASAADLAVHHKNVDLFLDRSFSSMKEVAGDLGSVVAKWIFQLGGASFDLMQKLPRIQGRVLVANGIHDKTMHLGHFERLKAALAAHKRATFLHVQSTHHHTSNRDLWFHPENQANRPGQEALEQFLRNEKRPTLLPSPSIHV